MSVADATVQIGHRESPEETRKVILEVTEELKAEGMTWGLYTDYPEHRIIVVDAWKVRPEVQEPTPPFLTRTDQ